MTMGSLSRRCFASLCLLLLQASTSAQAGSSFQRDVVLATQNKASQAKKGHDINDALLAKSIPLAEYEAQKLDLDGNRFRISERGLQDNVDDFFVDYNDMYSFSGYSIKYAKCQPVQYFSEDAIAAGEHSPMITEDIVILRLCPYKSCTESAQYGCHYNYAEYAIALSDYLAIMLKYSAKRRDSLCNYCETCGVVYQGTSDAGDDQAAADGGRRRRRLEEVQNDDAAGAQDNQAQGDDANADNQVATCDNVDTICVNYDTECGNPDNEDGDGYLPYEEYLDYLKCAEVKYNDHAYFVRPRCDGYKGTIKMAVYYDTYCVQYAGNDVDVKDFGLGFREGQFENFYSGGCIDCSESDQAPFYNTNTTLCNKLHSTSAKCTSDLLYNLFDGEENSATECSYIESIRFGTYDEDGKLSSATSGVTWSTEISKSQSVMLVLSIACCIGFVIYSCYLHHAMTNLLIKSLSHRELLPPSRHRQSRRAQKSSSSRNHQSDSDGSDNDWEKPGLV
jgi:hypothetical protein